MSDTYVERIVKLIASHRHEIERLEIALSVMGQLMEQDTPRIKLSENKTMAESVPAITIRRIAAPEHKEPKPKKSSAERTAKTIMRDKIMASLRKNGAQTSGTLIAEMYPKGSTKAEKQVIYVALNDWMKRSVVRRGPTGTYELVEQSH
jgi:hypothetical protein